MKADYKEVLKKDVQKTVDEFIDTVISHSESIQLVYKSVLEKEAKLDTLIADKEVELQSSKDYAMRKKLEIDDLQSSLEETREQNRRVLSDYDKMRSNLSDERKEIAGMKEKLKTDVAVAEDNRLSVRAELERAEKQKAKYDKLAKLLERDVDQIQKDKEQNKIDRMKLDNLKADLNRKETELIDEKHLISDLGLEMKAREKEVERLIKRYNLKQSIGVE